MRQIKNGSEEQNFAVGVAAFIGVQVKGNGNGEYINMYFPRDMALGFPVDAAIDLMNGQNREAGLYHISRDSFGGKTHWANYNWMSGAISDVAHDPQVKILKIS